ncbi:MAG: hypothetical protein ACLP1X_18580 [Polyangiaceae bacterium]|jgi:hypothetical protein
MKKTHLAGCPACARHLRVTEAACPFCGLALPSSFRELKAPPPPATRLSRAALYALRVSALSVTTVACGGSIGTGGGERDSGSSDATSIGDAAYGGPPLDASEDSGQGDAQLMGNLDAGFTASYGGFIPVDGSFVNDGNVAVPYGLPPQPDAGPTDANSLPDVVYHMPPPPYGAFPAEDEPAEPEKSGR